MPEFHPKFIGCKSAIEDMLVQLKYDDRRWSYASILLPFDVQDQIVNLRKLGDSSNCRLLYVELIAKSTKVEQFEEEGFCIV